MIGRNANAVVNVVVIIVVMVVLLGTIQATPIPKFPRVMIPSRFLDQAVASISTPTASPTAGSDQAPPTSAPTLAPTSAPTAAPTAAPANQTAADQTSTGPSSAPAHDQDPVFTGSPPRTSLFDDMLPPLKITNNSMLTTPTLPPKAAPEAKGFPPRPPLRSQGEILNPEKHEKLGALFSPDTDPFKGSKSPEASGTCECAPAFNVPVDPSCRCAGIAPTTSDDSPASDVFFNRVVPEGKVLFE